MVKLFLFVHLQRSKGEVRDLTSRTGQIGLIVEVNGWTISCMVATSVSESPSPMNKLVAGKEFTNDINQYGDWNSWSEGKFWSRPERIWLATGHWNPIEFHAMPASCGGECGRLAE